jgi:nitroreductase
VDTYLAIASKRDWRRYADRPVPDDVQQRILDAGRLAGSAMNRQPWTFVVVGPAARERLAETVYAPANVRTAALVIAIVAAGQGGWNTFDAGRAAQNMMLAAWNDGVVSCPNGPSDADRAAEALGLEGEERPVSILTFGYPARERHPEESPAEEWSREANRKPLDEVVRQV